MPPTELPLLLIVVGTSVSAERRDRPLGYRLRERVLRELDRRVSPAEVLVVSDALYLRDGSLQAGPAIAIGPPEDNAASALAEGRVPVVLDASGALTVLMDLDFEVPLAAAWGASDANTARASDALAERHLGPFLERWLG
jgi:hypothetical protein